VSEDVQYVQRVSRFRSVGQKYWFDLLIALLAISAMLEVVVGRDSPGAPSTTPWFCLPAIVILVLGHAASDGLGHGLVGIRERVKIYGGEMTAGTENGGGFVLSRRLPLSGDRR
jgi:hypothetical protein